MPVAEQSAAMVGGDNSDDDTPPVSCCGVVTPYSQFRAVLSPIDFTLRLTARTTIWMDTLKMSASTQSMLVSGCKSFDFLLGFVMAKLTDSHVPESIRTRFGRRRPFIAIFFPLGLVFFVIFCNATWFFETEKVDRPCANLTIDAEEPGANASFCPQLRMCLDEAIAEGRLFAPGNTTMPANMSRLAGGPSGGALATLFVITYFGFIFCTWTSVQIPCATPRGTSHARRPHPLRLTAPLFQAPWRLSRAPFVCLPHRAPALAAHAPRPSPPLKLPSQIALAAMTLSAWSSPKSITSAPSSSR